MTEIGGPRADEFLLKVQQATAGPPWYMDSPDAVYYFFICFLMTNIIAVSPPPYASISIIVVKPNF